MAGVLDDGNDVGAARGHVDKIAAGTVRELDGEDLASRANNVGDVGDGCSRGSTEVKDLGSGLHVDGLETAEDTSGKLGAEGIPDAVLGLGSSRAAVVALAGVLDDDTLLAVDRLAGAQILGSEQILLSAAGDENALMAMGLLQTVN